MAETEREKVAAVIVTFNRKEALKECIDAVLRQTRRLDAIYIIDNASVDGTPEFLVEKGFVDEVPHPGREPVERVKTLPSSMSGDSSAEIHYVRMHENTGGAGGFYEGIRRSYDAGFDWLWLMDDDGIPAENQLFELLTKSRQKNLLFTCPLVIDKDNEQALTFRPAHLRNVSNSVEAIKTEAEDGVIYDWVTPFNGTLVSRKVVERIGNIKKEMFIWGDEREYVLRTQANNIRVGTIITALHWHPARKGKRERLLFGLLGRVIVRPADKAGIYYRNLGYLHSRYYGLSKHVKTVIKHTVYYLINLRCNIKGLIGFYRYYIDGVRDRYSLPPRCIGYDERQM
ncbi:MAG: glycosyltransferase [Nitrospirae bacterium]|nr:glycosyltransferase [Nitrospirota bacterium]